MCYFCVTAVEKWLSRQWCETPWRSCNVTIMNPRFMHDDVIKWKTFSALLALCAVNSPVTGEFSSQRPETRSFDVFFDLCLNKRLSKQSWGWWFETPSCPLWRHCNVTDPPSQRNAMCGEVFSWWSGSLRLVIRNVLEQTLRTRNVLEWTVFFWARHSATVTN